MLDILLFFAIAAIAAAAIIVVSLWCKHNEDADLVLTFDTFKRDYDCVASVFVCNTVDTICKIDFHDYNFGEVRCINEDECEDEYDECVRIGFNFWDYIKYLLWFREVHGQKVKSNERAAYAKYQSIVRSNEHKRGSK